MHASFRDGFEKEAAPMGAMNTWSHGNALATTLRKGRAVAAESVMNNPYPKMKPPNTAFTDAAKSGYLPKFNPKPTQQPQA
jgi:hypothetical protein